MRTLLHLPQLTINQLDCGDYVGRTALHEAASLQFVDLAECPERVASDGRISKRDVAFNQEGSATAVRLLLDARAAVTVVDHSGQTPLDAALLAGQTEAARLLESAASSPACAAAAASLSTAVRCCGVRLCFLSGLLECCYHVLACSCCCVAARVLLLTGTTLVVVSLAPHC